VARCLLGEEPVAARLTFDPKGSQAPTYKPLGVDLAFTSGVMGWSILDEDYAQSIERARKLGVEIEFLVRGLQHSQHPNAILIQLTSRTGKELIAGADSTGGGAIRFTYLDGWPIHLTGKWHDVLVEATKAAAPKIESLLSGEDLAGEITRAERGEDVLFHAHGGAPLAAEVKKRLETTDGVKTVRISEPIFHVQRGDVGYSSAKEMLEEADSSGRSLGQIALDYESKLLGFSENQVANEIAERLEVMKASVRNGLDDSRVDMLLLTPTARKLVEAEAQGKVAIGGIHTRAAARSMAVMHTCNSRGVVCAAPTGGSAGVLAGVAVSLMEERGLAQDQAILSLLAASAVGLIVAKRATFAAETAGCQVEIGVAGAMAAAAVVEAVGGTARRAADAAAISLQNTMGSVCDPVQGTCEIPCHSRNAVAASSALTCADLILGGYKNHIPLDETIDASYAVGKALPRELRCTAAGGLAVTPSARSLPRLR
jgi:L-serine dehydratase